MELDAVSARFIKTFKINYPHMFGMSKPIKNLLKYMLKIGESEAGRIDHHYGFQYFIKLRKEDDLRMVVRGAKTGFNIFLKGMTKAFSEEEIRASWQIQKMLQLLAYLISGSQGGTMCIFKYAAEDRELAVLATKLAQYDFPKNFLGESTIVAWTRAYLKKRLQYQKGDKTYTNLNEYHFIER